MLETALGSAVYGAFKENDFNTARQKLYSIYSAQNKKELFKTLRKGATFVGIEFPDHYEVTFP